MNQVNPSSFPLNHPPKWSRSSAEDAAAAEVEAAVALVNVRVCGDDCVDVVFAQLDGRSLPLGRRSGDSNGRKSDSGDGEQLHGGCLKATKSSRLVQGTLVKSSSPRMSFWHVHLQSYE